MQPEKLKSLKATLILSVIAGISGAIAALPAFAQIPETIESPANIQTRTVHFSVEGCLAPHAQRRSPER